MKHSSDIQTAQTTSNYSPTSANSAISRHCFRHEMQGQKIQISYVCGDSARRSRSAFSALRRFRPSPSPSSRSLRWRCRRRRWRSGSSVLPLTSRFPGGGPGSNGGGPGLIASKGGLEGGGPGAYSKGGLVGGLKSKGGLGPGGWNSPCGGRMGVVTQ